ncbi:MAG: hypothetical protein P8175_08805, partial [Deltaproteobacteria bacterium]
ADSTQQTLKLMPIPSPESATSKADLVTAISKVAESTVPAVVLIEVSERKEVPNPLLPYENNPFFQKFFGLPKKMPKKFKEELMGWGAA